MRLTKEQLDNILTKDFLEQKYGIDGLLRNEIANQVGCSIGSVYQYLKKYGIIPKKKRVQYLVGQTINSVEILEFLKDVSSTSGYKFRCKCPQCGRKDWVVTIRNIKSRKTHISCGCSRNKTGSKHFRWRGFGEISQYFFGSSRSDAEKRGIKFNVTKEYIWELFLKQNRKCLYSGVEIVFPVAGNSKARSLGTASLDRIDSTKGYIEGNVQWVHKYVNIMKWILTEKQFLNFCKLIYENKHLEKLELLNIQDNISTIKRSIDKLTA